MNSLRGLLLHTGVIGSFVCITANILDWYNPYMDFTGHVRFMQLLLYFVVILAAFIRKPQTEAIPLKKESEWRMAQAGRQGRKSIRIEKISGNASRPGTGKADARKADKEKMKELAKKKRELEEELDELQGNTAKGKALCAVVFLLAVSLSFGLFAAMIKLNVGGFAGDVLAPAIADIPVLRSILPADMQKKSPSELAAEQAEAEESALR